MAKRLVDILVSVVALTALSPLMVVIAGLIRWDSPGAIIHRARRAGRFGRAFTMYKFRTMQVNRPTHGSRITVREDNRITTVGRALRRTKFDELPQFWNVLIGDMSLVGPRPEDPHYVAMYTAEQRRVLAARPGITSLASVQYRDEERTLAGQNWEHVYVSRVMPAKLEIDLDYIDHQSLLLDARVLLATAKSLLWVW